MSAFNIHQNAPLGSIISFSDGTPMPPERFKNKLRTWKGNNGRGQLVRKRAEHLSPASFTLHETDLAADAVIIMRVYKTYSVDSALNFEIIEQPKIGQVRVLQTLGDDEELLHLADSRIAAEHWLEKSGYRNVRLEEVTADEVAAANIEGRTLQAAE